jgi:ankyrin repeat protein
VNQAQVEAGENTGQTALHPAAANAHVDVVNALLTQGADVKQSQVDAGAYTGMTALHWAAIRGDLNVMNALLRAGADVNKIQVDAGEHTGKTALHWAAISGDLIVVNALLEQGADVNQAQVKAGRNTGKTALNLATERQCAIMDLPKDSVADKEVKLPLFRLTRDYAGIVNALLVRDADPNSVTDKGFTPLHSCICRGSIDENTGLAMVTSLIRAGANVNAIAPDGKTPVVIAYERGYHAIVRILLQNGAVLPERYARAWQEANILSSTKAPILINTSQSTHTASVHRTVARSIQKLKRRYASRNVEAVLSEIEQWIGTCQKDWEKQSTPTDEAKAKHEQDALAYSMFSILKKTRFSEASTGITLREALAYVWCGVNDEAQIGARLPKQDGSTLNTKEYDQAIAKEQKNRRDVFLNHLYQTGNEYDLDIQGHQNSQEVRAKKSCTSGAFNKVIETLNGGYHDDVEIIVLTKQQANAKAPMLLSEQLLNFSDEQIKYTWSCAWIAGNDQVKEMYNAFSEVILRDLRQEFGEAVSNDDLITIMSLIEDFSPNQAIVEYVKIVKISLEIIKFLYEHVVYHDNLKEKSAWLQDCKKFSLPNHALLDHFKQAIFAHVRAILRTSDKSITNLSKIPMGKITFLADKAIAEMREEEKHYCLVNSELLNRLKSTLCKEIRDILQQNLPNREEMINEAQYRAIDAMTEVILDLLRYAYSIKATKGKEDSRSPDEGDDRLNDLVGKLGGYLSKPVVSGICEYLTMCASERYQETTTTNTQAETVPQYHALFFKAHKETVALIGHIKYCRKTYDNHLFVFTKLEKAMQFTSVNLESSDEFQGFFCGQNTGKDYEKLRKLGEGLEQRITVYCHHIPTLLCVHKDYSSAAGDILSELKRVILQHIDNPLKKLASNIQAYENDSHLPYGQKHEQYCAIQIQYEEAMTFERQLHAELPKIFTALSTNDITALKEIQGRFLQGISPHLINAQSSSLSIT